KDRITAKLSGIKELQNVATHIFTVPESSDIKAVNQNDEWTPVLVQWGCTSNTVTSNIDPLSTLLFRPRNTTDLVSINVLYTNGEVAADKQFYIDYNGRQSKEKTNSDGIYHRGRCKIGTSLDAFEIVNNERAYVHHFTVTKGGTYQAIFPFLTSANVTVVDQKNIPLPNAKILVTVNDVETEYTVNEAGMIRLENLEAGKDVLIKDAEGGSGKQYAVAKDNNEFVFQVVLHQYAPVTITVVDHQNIPQANYSMVVEQGGATKEYMTDENGTIRLSKVMVESMVKASSVAPPQNVMSWQVAEKDNNFIYMLGPAKEVRVRLVDRKDKPMPGIKIDFTYNGKTQTMTTNESGVCILPHSSFVDKEKVKVFIHMPKKEKKKKAEKSDLV
ncbi:MAG TPA: hypothetical protein VKH37_13365, partial [Ferruginibacter sp.]|nr:hypothetical protein [Ferruginibacter sp.]